MAICPPATGHNEETSNVMHRSSDSEQFDTRSNIQNRRHALLIGTGLAIASAAIPAVASANTLPVAAANLGTMKSVSDFGAVGDGATDDTSAIQAALNATFAAGGYRFLFLPPGTYLVSSPLSATFAASSVEPTGIIGHGATIRQSVAFGGPILQFNAPSGSNRYFLLEGFKINGAGQGTGTGNHGLVLYAPNSSGAIYNACIRDVSIEQCGGDAMQLIGNVF